MKKPVVAALALLVARIAAAENPAPAAAVDVQDLPPLPEATEERSNTATVLAASTAAEDVVVGAAKREQSLGNVASAVTVISGDRIRRFGYRTVGEALAAVAGAYLVDNRLSYSIGIRGLNIPGDYNTRILVLVDGATVNETWGSFAGIGFDNFVTMDDISRIELIRGPVSSVYGANAFFGIINIVTRGATETPHAWGRIGVNSINGAVASAGFAEGSVAEQIRGSVQAMDRFGFGESLGVVDIGRDLKGDGSDQVAASLVGRYHGTFGQLRAYRFLRDSPFAPYDGDPSVKTPYASTDTQFLAEGGHTEELSKQLSLTTRAYANIYRYTDRIIQIAQPPFLDYGQADTYGAEVRARYEILPRLLGLTAGTEASYNQTESHSYTEGSTSAPIPVNFEIAGVYAEVDGSPTNWLGFTAGIRYDDNSVIDQHVSPRAALFLAKPEKYGLKLLYAQGFRNPSAYEAFFTDYQSFAKPDHLNAETIASYEAVVWAKPVPGLSTRLSGFYWDARGVLQQEPFTDPVSGLMELQFQNVGRYVSQGLEGEASYRNSAGWYGFAGGAYSDVGTLDATGNLVFGGVPNAPKLTGAAGVSTPAIAGKAHVSTELVYVGDKLSRPDANNVEYSSPAWVGWNAALYVPDVQGFDVTAGVRNILGTRDQVIAPGDYDRTDTTPTTLIPFVPGEGREFYVKLGYSY